MIKRLLERLSLIKPQKHKLVISDSIIGTDKLTEYQLEIRTRLREKFNDLQIEIGRGNRLMINGVVITGGVIIEDVRNRKDYDNDVKFFSDEIKRNYCRYKTFLVMSTDEKLIEIYDHYGASFFGKGDDKQLKEWGNSDERIREIKIKCVKCKLNWNKEGIEVYKLLNEKCGGKNVL